MDDKFEGAPASATDLHEVESLHGDSTYTVGEPPSQPLKYQKFNDVQWYVRLVTRDPIE